MAVIYVLEDDEDIRELVVYALKTAGHAPEGFADVSAFDAALAAGGRPGLALLDVMLPGEDGLSALRRLRRTADFKHTPVIMLSARGSELDKVKGLDAGADDYIAKPFGVMELISRVNAALRRGGGAGGGALVCGGVVMDEGKRTVTAGGADVRLTHREFELLKYFMINKGLALTREKLLEAVWGFEYEGETRTVDMHIKTLRQKLGGDGAMLKTIRNVGYKLEE